MSGHEAHAVRRNGPGAVWFAVCPKGCRLDRAQSKGHAEFIADEHARVTTCHCYDVASMEWAPTAPCGPYCKSGAA